MPDEGFVDVGDVTILDESFGGDDTSGGVVGLVFVPLPPVIEELAAGTVASGLIVSANEILEVTSDSIVSATTVMSGGGIEILSGGKDFGTTINAGGFSYVDSGGLANGSILGSGAGQIVSSGATASGTSIGSGATIYVLSGAGIADTIAAGGALLPVPENTILDFGVQGYRSDAAVGSGITLDVASGGLAWDTSIFSGGVENVYAAGRDIGATIGSGGIETVLSGGTVSGATIAGGELVASSGGTVTDVSFTGGGTLSLDDPGEFSGVLSGWQFGDTLDFRNLVLSNVSIEGPAQFFSEEGLVYGTLLDFSVGAQSYSYELLGVPPGATLISGGDGSSGTALSLDLIAAGQSLYISSGQISAGLLVDGFLGVMSGGGADAMAIDDLGVEVVSSGGKASSTTVESGGQLEVDRGGVAGDSIIESGGNELGFGNVNGTVVGSGGTIVLPWASGESVATLAADKGVPLDSGAILGIDIQSGTAVSGLVITDNVFDQVEGSTIATQVASGGTERVSAGGTISGTTVESGGTESVGSGGVAENAVVAGALNVSSGGAVLGAAVESGGVATVFGTASDTTVGNGGFENIYSGIESGGIVEAGGKQQIFDGGSAIGTTIYGETDVNGISISGQRSLTKGARISSGGQEFVSVGGLAQNAIVDNGGSLDLQISGFASDTTVSSGGSLLVEYAGRADGTVILNGGTATLVRGGLASGSVISSGGTLTVSSGGVASGTTVLDGGVEIVSAGAFVSGAIVSSGGELLVKSGGSIEGFPGGPTIAGGGLLVLESGADTVSRLQFVGSGGVLQIDSTTTSPSIDGFRPGDVVDLANFGFASGGSAMFVGGDKLEIVENGETFNLFFDENLAGYTFQLSADQTGGTEITAIASDLWVGPSSNDRSGDWATSANWGNQHLPTDLSRVVFNGTIAYTVTSDKNRKIESLALSDQQASLVLDGGKLALVGPNSKNEGTIAVGASAILADSGAFLNDGTIAVNVGHLTIGGALNGSGTVTIAAGTVELGGRVATTETVGFVSGTVGTLDIAFAQKFAGTVAGLAQGDALDLENIAFSDATLANVSGTGAAGTSTIVTVKGAAVTARIALLNQYANEFAVDKSAYELVSDQNKATTPGTLLELAPPHSI